MAQVKNSSVSEERKTERELGKTLCNLCFQGDVGKLKEFLSEEKNRRLLMSWYEIGCLTTDVLSLFLTSPAVEGRPEVQVEGMRLMLEHGFPVEMALTEMAKHRQAAAGELVTVLVEEFGADVNLRSGIPIYNALKNGSDQFCLALIRHGVLKRFNVCEDGEMFAFFEALSSTSGPPQSSISLRVMQKLFTWEIYASAEFCVMLLPDFIEYFWTPLRFHAQVVNFQSGLVIRCEDDLLSFCLDPVLEGITLRAWDWKHLDEHDSQQLCERFGFMEGFVERERQERPPPDARYYLPSITIEDFLMDVSPKSHPKTFRTLPIKCRDNILSLQFSCRRFIRKRLLNSSTRLGPEDLDRAFGEILPQKVHRFLLGWWTGISKVGESYNDDLRIMVP